MVFAIHRFLLRMSISAPGVKSKAVSFGVAKCKARVMCSLATMNSKSQRAICIRSIPFWTISGISL